jgi:hypothetical protein
MRGLDDRDVFSLVVASGASLQLTSHGDPGTPATSCSDADFNAGSLRPSD